MEKQNRYPAMQKGAIAGVIILVMNSTPMAVNAPYLINAAAVNEWNVSLTWRNNDLEADKVVVLRSSSASAWLALDTVAASPSEYIDLGASPATTYDYALMAYMEPDGISEMSNSISVSTPTLGKSMALPDLTLHWDRDIWGVIISFIDSASAEEGFRIFRREIGMDWLCIDTLISSSPAYMGAVNDTDNTMAVNTWYEYRVEVYNDSVSNYSPVKCTYTYQRPSARTVYAIEKLSSFPINRFDWVEKLGDSVYVQEVLPQGGTAIGVINISQPSSPQFKAYLDPADLPAHLKGTIIDAYRLLGVRFNNELLQAGEYYLALRSNSIYLSKSLTEPYLDSIEFSTTFVLLEEAIDDSCALVCLQNSFSTIMTAIKFGPEGIDTLGEVARLQSGGMAQRRYGSYFWGVHNGNAVTMSYLSLPFESPSMTYTYTIRRIPESDGKQYEYSEEVGSDQRFGSYNNNVIDNGIVFDFNYLYYEKTIYAYDISDDRSGPSFNLGTYVDSSYEWGTIRNTIIDTLKNRIFVFSDQAMSIYGYTTTPLASRKHRSVNRHSGKIDVAININGTVVFTAGINPGIISNAAIFDMLGRRVHTVIFNSEGRAMWNRSDITGNRAARGCYFLAVSSNTGIQSARFLLP